MEISYIHCGVTSVIASMRNLCEKNAVLKVPGLKLVETVHELTQLLLEYRSVINDENKDNTMSCTVNLLVSPCCMSISIFTCILFTCICVQGHHDLTLAM